MTRRDALCFTFRPPTLWRSLAVALVVGSILNLINQGDALTVLNGVVWWRVALTFCVPFLVASYGSYSALRTRD